MISIKDNTQAKGKGERLRRLRRIANLERRDLALKYGVNYETLKGWENGKHGGLTKKRAEFFVTALKSDGVECTAEWLLYGIGQGPQIIYQSKTEMPQSLLSLSHLDKAIANQIQNELILFSEKHPSTLSAIVTDHCMEPAFQKGDIVAGVKLYEATMKKGVRSCCLLQTLDGQILLRYLREITKKGDYIFIGLNHLVTTPKITIPQTDLVTIAPVLWHRHPHTY